MMSPMRSMTVPALLVFLACPPLFAATPQTELETRRTALNDLLAESWEYNLRTNPIFDSILRDKR